MSPARRAVLILIAATLLARIVFGFSLGLGIDESYTVATGRHPQLSTFDHPPAAWWLAWGASRLFATESALALRLPFILLFALTTWLMYRLTAFLFGEKAGFWAAATLNLAPVIAWTSGTWILPDGPLNAALVAGAYAAALAVFGAAVDGSALVAGGRRLRRSGAAFEIPRRVPVCRRRPLSADESRAPPMAFHALALRGRDGGGRDIPARDRVERAARVGVICISGRPSATPGD